VRETLMPIGVVLALIFALAGCSARPLGSLPEADGIPDPSDDGAADAAVDASADAGKACPGGDPGTDCINGCVTGDVLERRICRNGVWECPAGTFPRTMCHVPRSCPPSDPQPRCTDGFSGVSYTPICLDGAWGCPPPSHPASN
jgi:hypothetical protein